MFPLDRNRYLKEHRRLDGIGSHASGDSLEFVLRALLEGTERLCRRRICCLDQFQLTPKAGVFDEVRPPAQNKIL